ncbi:MAG: acyltransferase, wsdgatmgat subfamily protein [Actinomycetia bacterium]|nr:acyltransferase, wsdgatmgat subfamily protein [Actinomycetes bacterium]
MKRLSGLDAAFLAIESERWPTHVACITVFDPADCPGGYDIDRFKQSLADRLHLLPPLRWRLVDPPLSLGRPHWIEDPDFDLDWHIRRIGLPAPGGRKELAEVCTEIYRHRLDRRRPLWELWVIEGLEHGHVAVFWKIHHACIDGIAGASMQEVMFDPDPSGGSHIVPPEVAWEPEPFPSGARMFLSSLPSFAATPIRLAKEVGRMVPNAPELVRTARAGGLPLPGGGVPRTRFNDAVNQQRAWGYCSISLDDVKVVKNHFGVKVNDVVLAISAGSVRSWLDARGELPAIPLAASVPVSIRGNDGEVVTGNAISGMPVSLATDIDDPVLRLHAIHANALAAKDMQRALGADTIMNLVETPPPAMLSLALRFYAKTNLVKRHPPVTNLPISNVPGPPTQLYVLGAPIKAFFSMGLLVDGAGLFIGAMSYKDQMDFGILTCKSMCEDPFELADGIVEELQTLVKATKS